MSYNETINKENTETINENEISEKALYDIESVNKLYEYAGKLCDVVESREKHIEKQNEVIKTLQDDLQSKLDKLEELESLCNTQRDQLGKLSERKIDLEKFSKVDEIEMDLADIDLGVRHDSPSRDEAISNLQRAFN